MGYLYILNLLPHIQKARPNICRGGLKFRRKARGTTLIGRTLRPGSSARFPLDRHGTHCLLANYLSHDLEMIRLQLAFDAPPYGNGGLPARTNSYGGSWIEWNRAG